MSVFLFDELIFGPVHSRRLGMSLGINLLPTHRKLCTFNCIYCECGWTKNRSSLRTPLPPVEEFLQMLRSKLLQLKGTALQPDSITFAGNGEPTMHPDFPAIVEHTLRLRDEVLPSAKVSVLSNGSMIHHREVAEALGRVDNNILKLDGGNEEIVRAINMPLKAFRLDDYVRRLCDFRGNLILQTLFVRGRYQGKDIDNTTPAQVNDWIGKVRLIQPRYVMIYSIERDTALEGLVKVPAPELERIADQVRIHHIEAEVYS
ncbi:MAG: radical SAM protein [Bacteroidetes bacterium]|nr:radical SAM protein [Bacteroidota bacterium]